MQTLKDLLEKIDGNIVTFNVIHNKKRVFNTTITFVRFKEDTERPELMHFFNHHINIREPVINQQLWIDKDLLDKYILKTKPMEVHYIFNYEF